MVSLIKEDRDRTVRKINLNGKTIERCDKLTQGGREAFGAIDSNYLPLVGRLFSCMSREVEEFINK